MPEQEADIAKLVENANTKAISLEEEYAKHQEFILGVKALDSEGLYKLYALMKPNIRDYQDRLLAPNFLDKCLESLGLITAQCFMDSLEPDWERFLDPNKVAVLCMLVRNTFGQKGLAICLSKYMAGYSYAKKPPIRRTVSHLIAAIAADLVNIEATGKSALSGILVT